MPSRYMEVLALGIMVNMTLLSLLWESAPSTRSASPIAKNLWVGITLAGIVSLFLFGQTSGMKTMLKQSAEVVADANQGDFWVPRTEKLTIDFRSLLANQRARALFPPLLQSFAPVPFSDNRAFSYQNGHPVESSQARKVVSSYQAESEGEVTTSPIDIEQDFVEIDVSGDIGAEGIGLKIVGTDFLRQIDLESEDARTWHIVRFANPRQPLAIVAQDQSSESWLAFTQLVGVGRLSILFDAFLSASGFIVLLGLLMLFLGFFSGRSVG